MNGLIVIDSPRCYGLTYLHSVMSGFSGVAVTNNAHADVRSHISVKLNNFMEFVQSAHTVLEQHSFLTLSCLYYIY